MRYATNFLISNLQGFVRLRIHNRRRLQWLLKKKKIHYVRQAQKAKTKHQGFVLLSSDRGGIGIGNAKNRICEVIVFWCPDVSYLAGSEIGKGDCHLHIKDNVVMEKKKNTHIWNEVVTFRNCIPVYTRHTLLLMRTKRLWNLKRLWSLKRLWNPKERIVG